MKQASRPAIFKWRQTEPGLILCAVRWYLRSLLSFREAVARPAGEPHDPLALGPALRSRTGGATAPSSHADPSVLACR